VLDVAYVGNRTRRLPVSAGLNIYPVSELGKPDSSKLERRLGQELDTPHRFTAASAWILPFGRRERWLAAAPGWVDQIAGGWQLNWFAEIFSGYPIDHPNGPKTVDRSAALPDSERRVSAARFAANSGDSIRWSRSHATLASVWRSSSRRRRVSSISHMNAPNVEAAGRRRKKRRAREPFRSR